MSSPSCVPADDRAVERAARRDRVLHDHVVGLAERDREHGVHLLVLLDQPHELLRGVADLLRRAHRGAADRAARDGSTVSAPGAQHPELELLAHLVEPVLELGHLRPRGPGRGTAAREYASPTAASDTFFISTSTSTARSRSVIAGSSSTRGRPPLGRARELAHLGDALARAPQDQHVVGRAGGRRRRGR